MTLSVFIIEDMRPAQHALAQLLAGDNFKVVGDATTEAEAIFWLEQNPRSWDLLIVDLVLDQGTGLGVIAKARATGQGSIVIFSSFATPGIEAHCRRLGADAVFDKSDGPGPLLAYCAALKAAKATAE